MNGIRWMNALLLSSVVSVAGCGTVGRDSLVHLEVHDAPAENGKRLNMRFDEVERTADASIVQVTFDSGGSVSSSTFIAKGVCTVLADRHENYVVSTPLDTHGGRYRLTFFEREADAPQHRMPHREGRPDRTRSDALSRGMCGLMRLVF